MRKLCTFLILLAIGVVVLGFFLNWFHLSSESTEQTVQLIIIVDKEKLAADKDRAVEQIQEAGRKLQEFAGKGKKETVDSADHPNETKPAP
jgi:hypothetical protein